MSAYSCYNILKSQAKDLCRERGIKHAAALELVAASAKFSNFHELTKTAETNPLEIRLMAAALGVTDLRSAIHEDGVPESLEWELTDQLSGAIAETNAHGFSLTSLAAQSAEYDSAKGRLALNVTLTYRGKQHQDRMYSGTAFFLDCAVTLLRRNGAWKLAEEDGLLIISGQSDRDRDHERELADLEREYLQILEPQKVSFEQALADELDIDIDVAAQLTEAKIIVNDSEDGLVYGYWLDLETVESESLKRKLMSRFGSLQIELQANFFDQVEKSPN